jgi:hypothetical protein
MDWNILLVKLTEPALLESFVDLFQGTNNGDFMPAVVESMLQKPTKEVTINEIKLLLY